MNDGDYTGPVPLGSVVAEKYEVLRLLGMGGMGAVYEARHRQTLKRCALKLLVTAELGRNASIVQRFFREARASSAFESDHVVVVYDSGVDAASGYPFMVMELLSGEDLEGTVRRLGPLSPPAALKLVMQAATGLARAHEQGVVHRDIKPANLFLTQRESGEYLVKLLDFGIAKVKMQAAAEQSSQLTRTGSILGTPLYMSPEQARSSSSIDGRADVWSLGVVLYELLSGQPPHAEQTSLGELMVSIITSDARPIREVAPWLDSRIAELVHRALAREPAKRYANAGELLAALNALLPEGSRLTPETLVSISETERRGASRPSITPSSVNGATPSNLSITRALPASTRSKTGLLLGFLGTAVLISAALLGLSRVTLSPQPEVAASLGRSASAPGLAPLGLPGEAPTTWPELPPVVAAAAAPIPSVAPSASIAIRLPGAGLRRPMAKPAAPRARSEPVAAPSKPTSSAKAAGVIGDASEFN